MTLYQLNEIIENGENERTEFKRHFTECDKIAREMIAFANTKGGVILFGVDDNRRVVGVESEKSEIEYINLAAKFYCTPEINCDVEVFHIYRKDVIAVIIPESDNKPHFLLENGRQERDKKAYIRVKDKSVMASKETVKVLQKLRPDSPPQIFHLGDKEKALLKYLSTSERITLRELKDMFNISNRRASRMLVNLVRADIIRLHNNEKEDYYTLNN